IDLLVERLDDLSRRVFRHADAEPETRLIARHKLSHGRDVRQYVQARLGRHRERAQPASPDILYRCGRAGAVDLHLPAVQVGERGPRAAIRYVHEVPPGIILNSSPEMWLPVPVPADAMLSLRGLALA